MATWPGALPGPRKDNLKAVLGDNTLQRTTQSGRNEATRWGSGAPDRWSVPFRIRQEDVGLFEQFFKVTLNRGINWFAAPWISDVLGYPDHKARFLGAPELKAVGCFYRDYSAAILIKPSAACPADTAWPTSA